MMRGKCALEGKEEITVPSAEPIKFVTASEFLAEPSVSSSSKTKEPEAAVGALFGVRFDTGKSRVDLLDTEFLEQIGKVLAFGAGKYDEHNWRRGIAVSRNLAAALRHTFAALRGEDTDPESGLPHLAHAACDLMFAWWTIKHRPKFDDRWRDGGNT